MESGWALDFFRNPRDAAETRMRFLSAAASVRKARAKAEVNFRSQEVAANWRDWQTRAGEFAFGEVPIQIRDAIPPYWQAGVQYACMMIPAYGMAALEEMGNPAEFESFLQECTWIVSERTYLRKMQPYDCNASRSLEYAVTNFHRLVRTAVAAETARLSLEAWKRHERNLDGNELAGRGVELPEPISFVGGKSTDEGVGECSFEQERASDRDARLQLVSHDHCVSQQDADNTPAAVTGNLFRREQDFWIIRFQEQAVRLRHIVGFDYLAELLRQPGVEVEALALAGRGEPESEAVAACAGIEATDEKTLREVKTALDARRSELATMPINDWPTRGRLQDEIAKLEAYLSQAEGRNGRARKIAGNAERARTAVTNAIVRALQNIEKQHSDLGAHLHASVRTGTTLLYVPSEPVEWQF